MALVEVKNVYKIYNPGENEVHALDGVSLSINRGEYVAIIGQSGSGKSTLMNILGLLDVPTRGVYKLDGKNVAGLSDDELSELPLVYRGMPPEQREQLSIPALQRVGLGHRINHLPAQMSGGQQQRVAIARALAAKPPIILADEPTGNLDSGSGKEVMNMIHELHEEGTTVILITHDNEIAANAPRNVRIQDGKIVEDFTR